MLFLVVLDSGVIVSSSSGELSITDVKITGLSDNFLANPDDFGLREFSISGELLSFGLKGDLPVGEVNGGLDLVLLHLDEGLLKVVLKLVEESKDLFF